MSLNPFLAVLLVFIPSTGWASLPCSIDHGYPEVSDIAITNEGTVIQLGSYFENNRQPGERAIQLLSATEGWRRLEKPVPMSRSTRAEDCPVEPKIPTGEEFSKWYRQSGRTGPDADFEQTLVGCVEYEDETWSGISWYGGEGSWGVGGLISFNTSTQQTDGRYLWGLQDYSVSHLELFGAHLWIGTTYNGECGGPAPGFGVKRYSLIERKPFPKEFVALERTIPLRGLQVWDEPRICGFAARDMLIVDGDLWVATELGLSVVQIRNGDFEFHNYVPDLTGDTLMREVSCDDLYTELLESPRSITDEGFDIGVMFDQFWARLSKHRPKFTSRYLKRLHGHNKSLESTEKN